MKIMQQPGNSSKLKYKGNDNDDDADGTTTTCIIILSGRKDKQLMTMLSVGQKQVSPSDLFGVVSKLNNTESLNILVTVQVILFDSYCRSYVQVQLLLLYCMYL